MLAPVPLLTAPHKSQHTRICWAQAARDLVTLATTPVFRTARSNPRRSCSASGPTASITMASATRRYSTRQGERPARRGQPCAMGLSSLLVSRASEVPERFQPMLAGGIDLPLTRA
jgi:hypothetical protein